VKITIAILPFYEVVSMLLERIAKLPKISANILYKEIYKRLKDKRPTGQIAEEAYKPIPFGMILAW